MAAALTALAAQQQIEVFQIAAARYCFACACAVPLASGWPHVQGARHRKAIARAQQDSQTDHVLGKRQRQNEPEAAPQQPPPVARLPAHRSPAAMASSSSSASNTWTLTADSGELITVTNDFARCDEWVESNITSNGVGCVGLDTESSNVMYVRNELALIQVATTSAVLLFRAHHLRELPRRLRRMIEDEGILKYSFGPEKDLVSLCTIEANVDVQRAHSREQGVNMPGTEATANFYVPHLGFKKNKKLQMSNWKSWPLSTEQTRYAAGDAIVALAIGEEMRQRKLECQ